MQERRAVAMEHRKDGLTYREIGNLLGISPQRVQQLLKVPPSVRQIVVERAGGRCEQCGLKVGMSGHVHHQGGMDLAYHDLANLSLLCPGCHRRIHPGKIYVLGNLSPRQATEGSRTALTQHCRHCGWGFAPRVPHPKRCPNPKCQKLWPLGEPEKQEV